MVQKRRLCCSFVVAIGFLGGSLTAEAAKTNRVDDYLSLNLAQLMQVSVTSSTLRDESFLRVPSAVTVFTRAQLDSLGFDYLYEVLNLVPGFQSNRNADSPHAYTYSARGRRTGSAARELLLIVDGRDFTDPRGGSADVSFRLFPLALVEKVEVIRGPGSAIYGSSAFTGVINITTRTQKQALSLAVGSDNRRLVGVSGFAEGDDWTASTMLQGFASQGQHYRLKDYTGAPFTTTNDPYDSYDLNADLRIRDTQFRFTYHRLSTENFYMLESIGDDVNRDIESSLQFSLEHDVVFNERLKTHIMLTYSQAQQKFNTIILPENFLALVSEPASTEPMVGHALLAGERYALKISNDFSLGENDSLQFGLTLHNNRETDAFVHTNFDLTQFVQRDFPVRFYGDFSHFSLVGTEASQAALGVYGQYLNELNHGLHLTLGGRFDRYEHIGQHFSPRVGLVQELSAQHSFKLLYGEAYRAPSLSEIGLMNNPLVVGNPDLTYEIVKTWDLIWAGQWQNSTVTFGVFNNSYELPIVPLLINSTRTFGNGANQQSHGFESEWVQQLGDYWQLRTSYTKLFSLPDSALREADNFGSATLYYERANWGWNLAAIHHGERFSLNNINQLQSLSSYWLINTKVRYAFANNYEIYWQLKNVLNEGYMTPVQGNRLPQGVRNPGREWLIGLNWEW